MASFSKIELSGSTDGRPISVTATIIGSAQTIHTANAVTGADNYDEVYLYANNIGTATVLLTICWGGVTNPADLIEVSIPGEAGLVLVIPGLVLQNSLVAKAYAATTAVINLSGFVNRITA